MFDKIKNLQLPFVSRRRHQKVVAAVSMTSIVNAAIAAKLAANLHHTVSALEAISTHCEKSQSGTAQIVVRLAQAGLNGDCIENAAKRPVRDNNVCN